ncbi:MAG: VanZ family protein [Candidatus Brocadia sp.]
MIRVHWIFKCLLTLAYAFLIFAASSEDTSSITLPPYADKLIHFVLFGLLCLMICWALSSVTLGNRWIYKTILAIGITSFYGATDEIHQLFTPNRSVEIFDWLADTTGAVTAGFLWQIITHKWQIKNKSLAMEKTPIKM